MSREQQKEAKRARRRRRLASRNPGSRAHLRALTWHRKLGESARQALRGTSTNKVLDTEIEQARVRESARLLANAERLNIGATRMERLVAATQPKEA